MMTYRTANTLLDRIFSDLNHTQTTPPHPPVSSVDLLEFDNRFTVRLALPGVKAEDLEVSLEGRTLTVKGKFAELDNADARVLVHSLNRGEFSRTLRVPAGVGEGVSATIEHGILTLESPKPIAAQVRRIEVSSGSKSLGNPESAQA